MRITHEAQIDLERAIIDPEYRRDVIAYLNAQSRAERESRGIEPAAALIGVRTQRAA